MDLSAPVSYTHLDVYKRQELPALAEELSYAAISILPPVAANKAISEEFSDEERAYIVSNALYEIYSSAEELEHDRQLISNTFLDVYKRQAPYYSSSSFAALFYPI